MPRFFLQTDSVEGDTVTVCGADAYHIARSLRMAPGEEITVCDRQKREYHCRLVTIHDDEVVARVCGRRENDTEPRATIRLFQSVAKGEKMDYIVQKAVELGACEIVPVLSKRCIVRMDGAAAEAKRERWQKIAEGAAKQSGRGTVPSVRTPVSFQEALKDSAGAGALSLFCYEGTGTVSLRKTLSSREPDTPVDIFIGPEGGYEQAEAAQAESFGLVPTALGKRILRCETASGFVLACLVYQYEL